MLAVISVDQLSFYNCVSDLLASSLGHCSSQMNDWTLVGPFIRQGAARNETNWPLFAIFNITHPLWAERKRRNRQWKRGKKVVSASERSLAPSHSLLASFTSQWENIDVAQQFINASLYLGTFRAKKGNTAAAARLVNRSSHWCTSLAAINLETIALNYYSLTSFLFSWNRRQLKWACTSAISRPVWYDILLIFW